MTKSKAQGRITDALLDQIVGDTDPTELFQSGELLGEMRRKLAAALKPIYQAESADRAESLLDEFEQSELGQRYPDVVRSWRQRWTYVIPFFAFSPLLRKAIYTTNAIESLNATVRRAVRARGHFTSTGAAKKLRYLALREASAKWTAPMAHWQSFKREFAIHFEGRFNPSKGWVTRVS